jgi:chaperonin GroES
MSPTNLKPLGARVVVRPEAEEEVTASGIVLPDTASKEKPQRGEIIALGTGKITDDGKTLPLSVKVGDTIVFKKYSPTEIKVDNEELFILDEEDILAIVE